MVAVEASARFFRPMLAVPAIPLIVPGFDETS